ncbi:MAG TPA: tetratricopeptide repeat protein [Cyclobacteriaceae bacterium]|nr:tetratricopeptide repeat protein [Cyclobacteriaceae bacterium]
MDRLSQLKQFVAEDPDDPFNRYALALEFLKTDRAIAIELFDQLIRSRPDYLPTYYPFAHLLIDQKENEKAEQIFLAGIEQSKRAEDSKAMKELKGAYQDWLYERE